MMHFFKRGKSSYFRKLALSLVVFVFGSAPWYLGPICRLLLHKTLFNLINLNIIN